MIAALLAQVGPPSRQAPEPWVPHWLQLALDYRVQPDLAVTIARLAVVVLGVALVYFAADTRWRFGPERRIAFAGIGLLGVFQEGDQIAFHAPFLVWRLPLILLLELACASLVVGYVTGRLSMEERRR